MISVAFEGNIAVINLGDGENRLNSTFIREFHNALDKVESNEAIHTLITTGSGKFYCNGIDLNWLAGNSSDVHVKFSFDELPSLYVRLMTFPVLTIAAINGHAFAGGGILVLAHDYRIMGTDKGWFCMNEVHINLRFTEWLLEVMRHLLPQSHVFHECMVLGKRYTASEAVTAGIVQRACPQNQLLEEAKALAKQTMPKGPYDRTSLGNMKRDIFQKLIDLKEKHRLAKGATELPSNL